MAATTSILQAAPLIRGSKLEILKRAHSFPAQLPIRRLAKPNTNLIKISKLCRKDSTFTVRCLKNTSIESGDGVRNPFKFVGEGSICKEIRALNIPPIVVVISGLIFMFEGRSLLLAAASGGIDGRWGLSLLGFTGVWAVLFSPAAVVALLFVFAYVSQLFGLFCCSVGSWSREFVSEYCQNRVLELTSSLQTNLDWISESAYNPISKRLCPFLTEIASALVAHVERYINRYSPEPQMEREKGNEENVKKTRWTFELDQYLLKWLVKEVKNSKYDGTFRKSTLIRAARLVSNRFHTMCLAKEVANRMMFYKQEYEVIQKFKSKRDEIQKKITVEEEEEEYRATFPEHKWWLNRNIDLYDELSIVCPNMKFG